MVPVVPFPLSNALEPLFQKNVHHFNKIFFIYNKGSFTIYERRERTNLRGEIENSSDSPIFWEYFSSDSQIRNCNFIPLEILPVNNRFFSGSILSIIGFFFLPVKFFKNISCFADFASPLADQV